VFLLALSLHAAVPGAQRNALLALYNATGGPSWANHSTWGGPVGTECDWHGVTCNGGRNAVVGIALSSNLLNGPLPAALANLPQLQSLELEENGLSGGLPRELATLPELRELRLGLNSLSGPLPRELGSFAKLETLSLPFNFLSGSLPVELGHLATLHTLELGRNALTGAIPDALGGLASLAVLDLSENALTGPIPTALSGLSHLQSLFLGGNRLSGPIPPALGDLASLLQLDLSENALTGPIPPELGRAGALQFLDLRRNLLGGAIPPELGGLAALESLLLSGNRLGGTLPVELGNLVAVTVLWLDDNRFLGAVPEELAGLTELDDGGGLDLRGNALAADVDPGLLAYLNEKQGGGDWTSSQLAAAPLDPGTTIARLADRRSGAFLVWRIDLGAGASSFTVVTSGGSGNADLYLRRGAPPTATLFDAATAGPGNEESLAQQNPAPGSYYVGLRTTAAYSGVTLQVTGASGRCLAGDTTLCLSGDRFKVEARWRSADGKSGLGHARALASDTGTFWFFDPSNLEMVLKTLDGCGLNGSFWVFAGGLTNVQVDLAVTDTVSATVRTYRNPQGLAFQPIQDTGALATCGAAAAAGVPRRRAPSALDDGMATIEELVSRGSTACAADATHLCLAGGRFRVGATWKAANGQTGAAMAVPVTADTGTFWFFAASNLEMILKVLDACPLNSRFWVFAGGLTNVDTTIEVTDTMTGTTKTYHNPQGTAFRPIQDTGAFAGCP
jgi:hypothetical protein